MFWMCLLILMVRASFFGGYEFKQEISISNTLNLKNVTEFVIPLNTKKLLEEGKIKSGECIDILFTESSDGIERIVPHFLENLCGITNSNFWVTLDNPLNIIKTLVDSQEPAVSKLNLYYGKEESQITESNWMKNEYFLIPKAGNCGTDDLKIEDNEENDFFLRISNDFNFVSGNYQFDHSHVVQSSSTEKTQATGYGAIDLYSPYDYISKEEHCHITPEFQVSSYQDSTHFPPFLKLNFCFEKTKFSRK